MKIVHFNSRENDFSAAEISLHIVDDFYQHKVKQF